MTADTALPYINVTVVIASDTNVYSTAGDCSICNPHFSAFPYTTRAKRSSPEG